MSGLVERSQTGWETNTTHGSKASEDTPMAQETTMQGCTCSKVIGSKLSKIN